MYIDIHNIKSKIWNLDNLVKKYDGSVKMKTNLIELSISSDVSRNIMISSGMKWIFVHKKIFIFYLLNIDSTKFLYTFTV